MSVAAQGLKFKPVDINLLPGSNDLEKTKFGKILKWSLNVGRIIVVFTELIVIMAFLARFKLDRDLTILHESIEQKKSIITSASTMERNFRKMQERINKIPLLEAEQTPFDLMITDIAANTPIDVFINRVTIDKKSVMLSGVALSDAGLATLIYQLRSSPKFSEIELEGVNKKKDSPEIQFSVKTGLTSEAFKI